MMTYVKIFKMGMNLSFSFCIQSVSAFLWDAHTVSFVHLHTSTCFLCLAVHVNSLETLFSESTCIPDINKKPTLVG